MGFDNTELQIRDDRLDTILNGTMRSAGNGNFNIGQIATDAQRLSETIKAEFEDALYGSALDGSGDLSELEAIAHRVGDIATGVALLATNTRTRLDERASNNDGRADVWTRLNDERRRDEREKDKADEVSDFRQNARQAQQQLQAELEEHRRSQHTMGGVTMSGEEWARFADDIRNDERIRNSMRDYLIRQGLSPKDADKKLEDYANAASAMAKPPSQRTPADWAAIRRADNDRNYRGARAAAEAEQARGQDNTQVQIARTAESQDVSIDQRNDLLAGTLPQASDVANAMAKAPSQRTAADLAAIHRANNDANYRGASGFGITGDDLEFNRYMEARPSVRLIPDDLFTQSPEEILKAHMKELRATMSADPRYETTVGAEPPRNLMVRDSSFANSSAEGNVRSDINLSADFSAAKSATTPLDNPSLAQTQAPRQFAANQTTITAPENVL